MPHDIDPLAASLSAAGFVAADDEAAELRRAARGDSGRLAALLARRLRGEPLAWITGVTRFCGLDVRVDVGVYVPRWQTEALAREAAARLPSRGVAVDVATGSGALAMVLRRLRPSATVLATDISDRAVACARSNGVDALHGDLFAPLPAAVAGLVDVVTGVVPYVPTSALRFLPRDTLDFEDSSGYDGGPDGTDFLRRVVLDSASWLAPGGTLLLELGGDQAEELGDDLRRVGFRGVTTLRDEDGDVRGLIATYTPS